MSETKSYEITEQKKVNRSDIAFCMATLPGSESFYFGSSDSSVYWIDLSEEKPDPNAFSGKHGHSLYVTGIAVAASNKLISGSYDRRLIWWDLERRQSLFEIGDAHQKWIRQVKASPDGKTVASVADDMVCRLWDASSGKSIVELRGHRETTPTHYPSMLFACEFSPDGAFLATADKVGHIVVWEVASAKSVATLDAPEMYTWDSVRRRHSIGGIRSLAFSPDGKTLAAGGMGQVGNIDHLQGKARVQLFDWQKGETLAEIETSEIKGLVEKLAFHPDGTWLLGSGGDHKGFAIMIDPTTGKTILEEKKPSFHVHDFALSPDATSFIAVGHNQIATHRIVSSG